MACRNISAFPSTPGKQQLRRWLWLLSLERHTLHDAFHIAVVYPLALWRSPYTNQQLPFECYLHGSDPSGGTSVRYMPLTDGPRSVYCVIGRILRNRTGEDDVAALHAD